jgi:hypothetical protein
MRRTSRNAVIVAMTICLLALLVHPAAVVVLAAALVFTPVFLFGLVVAPQSLWPAANMEPPFLVPLLSRAVLFQRPPPSSIL